MNARQLLALALAAGAGVVLLTACGGDDDASSGATGSTTPTPTASTSPTPTSSATTPSATPSSTSSETVAPTVRTIEISVAGSTVTPAPARVDAAPNEPLRVVVTADRGGDLHAHGTQPELEVPVTPGQATSADFLAPAEPGLYEIELHDPDLLLFQLAVQ